MIVHMENSVISAWDKVLNSRMNQKYKVKEILRNIFEDFYELHGDRLINDDLAIIGGIAFLNNKAVTVIAQRKGDTTQEKILCNYGMTMPDGYRKSLRLMKQAEKFGRPIICFVDTPGAYPGIEAEERGQAEAIARNLYEMSMLKVPIISIVIGEGGSGGALALSVSNRLIMLENAIFSVVSPEGCASILWRDSTLAPEAAEKLKITSQDLLELEVVDYVIEEEKETSFMYRKIKNVLIESLRECEDCSLSDLIQMRYTKIRNIGKIL